MDIINGANLQIDYSRVPIELQTLIPMVARWGYTSQNDQDDFVALMQSYPSEIQKFNQQIDAHRARIIDWGQQLLKSSPEVFDARTVSDHPFFAFSRVLSIRDLTEPEDSNIIIKEKNRIANEKRVYNFKSARSAAEQQFREKKYSAYVASLEPFVDLLDEIELKKFEVAKRKID